MKRLLLFLAFVVLFEIANRGAYKGYFDGDDIENLNLSHALGADVLAQEFATPMLNHSNFRPVGQAFYKYFGGPAGLNFPRYIAFLHAVHCLNVILVWLLLRALGFEMLTAAFGTIFFAFHMGAFDIYWKPMFIFDLLCATFTLSSILLWLHNRWILSLVAFWCAFRSKELAIALPAVLAAIEYTQGTQRWKQLIPFFAASLSFGIQAALGNRSRDNDYSLRFTGEALKTCVAYYTNHILIVPFGGALVAALLFVKDKRARLGVVALLLLISPMLFLPGRLFGAYLYVPLIGLAIAATAFSQQAGRIASLIILLIWLPLNFREMQVRRKAQLTLADQNREYMGRIAKLMQDAPATNAFIFHNGPDGLHFWGVRAAARYARRPATDIKDAEFRTKEALELASEPNLTYLMWVPGPNRFYTVSRNATTPDIPYIAMDEQTPLWQLGKGWRGLEGKYQWTNLVAEAHLARPSGAQTFEVLVNVGKELIEAVKEVKLAVYLDDVQIGEFNFSGPGWRNLTMQAPPSTSSTAKVRLQSSPGYARDPDDVLGIAIGGFGFPTRAYPAAPAEVK